MKAKEAKGTFSGIKIHVYKTGHAAEYKWEAEVFWERAAVPVCANGKTPAEAVRKAMGWFIADRMHLI